jgi:alpha-tubulin suppressor-like RCC1 family protein
MRNLALPCLLLVACAPEVDLVESEAALEASGVRPLGRLAMRDSHACVIGRQGQVICWGSNDAGQLGLEPLGTGPFAPRAVPGVAGATSVSVGARHSCVSLGDGTVECWGSNAFGQLGRGTAGGMSATPTAVSGVIGAKQVVSGWNFACALLATGSVRCWGAGAYGQLGNGSFVDRSTPVAVSTFSDFEQLASGGGHVCGVRGTGGLACWGLNDTGQLGTYDEDDRALPVAPWWVIDVRQVVAGDLHTCALRGDGATLCWGYNANGELGDGSFVSRDHADVVPGVSSATTLFAGAYGTCALVLKGGFRCWGANVYGQLGIGTTSAPGTPTPTLATALVRSSEVAFGGESGCAVGSDGNLRCWGYRGLVPGAPASPIEVLTPRLVTLGSLARTATSLAVEGRIFLVRAGDGNRAAGATAGSTFGTTGAMFAPPTMVATTATHTCFVIADGRVQCMGANSFGELGDGTTIARTNPVSVSGFLGYTAVHVDVGNYTSCGVKANGEVECWGSSWAGRLGNAGATGPSSTPVSVLGLENRATQVAVAADTACALLVDGRVSCWGGGATGNAGDPVKSTAGLTASLGGVAVSLSGGAGNPAVTRRDGFCALLSSGRPSCWGAMPGNGADYSSIPVALLPEERAVAVEKNGANGCFITDTGKLYCWGENAYGQLGAGSVGDPLRTPRHVSGVSDVVAVSIGGLGHSQICALEADGELYCWGRNVGLLPVLQVLP